jgi:hypothetical protein
MSLSLAFIGSNYSMRELGGQNLLVLSYISEKCQGYPEFGKAKLFLSYLIAEKTVILACFKNDYYVTYLAWYNRIKTGGSMQNSSIRRPAVQTLRT